MRNRGRWLAAVLVAVTLSGACTGDDSDDDDPAVTDPVETTSMSSSTSSTTTVDPDAAAEAQVEAAYLAYWDAFLSIFAEPHPENPLVDRHTTGLVREATLDGITDMVVKGQSIQPPDDPAHFRADVLDVQVDEDRATVEACLIDGGRVVETETNNVLNDDVVTEHIEAIMILDGERWKVAESRVIDKRDGVWDCNV